jgi:hypothetical protein
MNQFITLLIAVEAKAVESKSQAHDLFLSEAKKIITSFSYSNQQELKVLLHENDLHIDGSIAAEDHTLLCQLYAVMLVMLSFESHLESKVAAFCRATLDDNIDTWEPVQHHDWAWFANNIGKAVARMLNSNSMKHYLISSAFQIDEISNKILHVAKCDNPLVDLRILQAEAALSVNSGNFDAEFYSTPCFDSDGFISYPDKITEIDESEFDLYKKVMTEITYFDHLGEMSAPVKEYLAYVFEKADLTQGKVNNYE